MTYHLAKFLRKLLALKAVSSLSYSNQHTIRSYMPILSWFVHIIFLCFAQFDIRVDNVYSIYCVFKKIIIILKHLEYPHCHQGGDTETTILTLKQNKSTETWSPFFFCFQNFTLVSLPCLSYVRAASNHDHQLLFSVCKNMLNCRPISFSDYNLTLLNPRKLELAFTRKTTFFTPLDVSLFWPESCSGGSTAVDFLTCWFAEFVIQNTHWSSCAWHCIYYWLLHFHRHHLLHCFKTF